MKRHLLTFIGCGALLAAGLTGAACSDDANSTSNSTSNSNGGGTTNGGGSTGQFGDGGSGGGQSQGLNITPIGPTLDVVYGTPGQTVQFQATKLGQPVNPTWYLNTPEAGSIDANGLFTANGAAGGDVVVTATFDDATASTTLHVNLTILENQAGLPQDQQDILTAAGGTPDGGFTSPYPYDGTIFPRAIPAPQVHVNGGGDAFMVRIGHPGCSYTGFFGSAAQLVMGQPQWTALGTCSDGTDFDVEIAKLAGGVKYGPITRKWRVATAKLHGTIYYNTYDSPLAGGTGAMMRIKGEATSPEVFVGGCTVCHSVASDGSTAAAANHGGPGGTFDLSSGTVNPPLVWTTPEMAAFGALYPKNGEVIVVQGTPGGSWPPNTPGSGGPYTASLHFKNGDTIPDSGIEGLYAQTPVFSHDGTMLAFTDRNAGNTSISVLALFDYDAATHKFSNYRVIGTPPAGHHFSWPAFTPDNKWVVYQDGVGEDLATWSANTGKLRAVNVQTLETLDLGMLNGDGYMPAGARDENLNFEPTILPISAGGYFWIMFTSRRTYGNVLTGTRDQTKRLWVAAFDANAASADPAHPAFYIAGQELTSGNSRGFWALDPCKGNGEGCETGDQCCGGFCNPSEDMPGTFVCGEPDGSCSEEFESCETAADCCDPSLDCIGGKCGSVPPQ
ncbi:MAG: hypothetical protein HOW73_44200 [Polyangiaceae bacterium]|nr:hypothetical protein [Polyangiaceae bacterium]